MLKSAYFVSVLYLQFNLKLIPRGGKCESDPEIVSAASFCRHFPIKPNSSVGCTWKTPHYKRQTEQVIAPRKRKQRSLKKQQSGKNRDVKKENSRAYQRDKEYSVSLLPQWLEWTKADCGKLLCSMSFVFCFLFFLLQKKTRWSSKFREATNSNTGKLLLPTFSASHQPWDGFHGNKRRQMGLRGLKAKGPGKKNQPVSCHRVTRRDN